MHKSFVAAALISLLLVISVPAWAESGRVVINAVGDIMLAGSGTRVYQKIGYDYPFANVATALHAADISVGNLEAPITRDGVEFTGKKFRFKMNPRVAGALKEAGFSVVTLANNHSMDFGAGGLRETLRYLDRAGLLHCGAGENLAAARKPALITAGKKTIAFLAYSLTLPTDFYAGRGPGTAPGYRAYYAKDIAGAKSIADHVVVSFHWGAEKSTRPKRYQISAAHQAIDAGADVVIGH